MRRAARQIPSSAGPLVPGERRADVRAARRFGRCRRRSDSMAERSRDCAGSASWPRRNGRPRSRRWRDCKRSRAGATATAVSASTRSLRQSWLRSRCVRRSRDEREYNCPETRPRLCVRSTSHPTATPAHRRQVQQPLGLDRADRKPQLAVSHGDGREQPTGDHTGCASRCSDKSDENNGEHGRGRDEARIGRLDERDCVEGSPTTDYKDEQRTYWNKMVAAVMSAAAAEPWRRIVDERRQRGMEMAPITGRAAQIGELPHRRMPMTRAVARSAVCACQAPAGSGTAKALSSIGDRRQSRRPRGRRSGRGRLAAAPCAAYEGEQAAKHEEGGEQLARPTMPLTARCDRTAKSGAPRRQQWTIRAALLPRAARRVRPTRAGSH
jgi:hypothetical protein